MRCSRESGLAWRLRCQGGPLWGYPWGNMGRRTWTRGDMDRGNKTRLEKERACFEASRERRDTAKVTGCRADRHLWSHNVV